MNAEKLHDKLDNLLEKVEKLELDSEQWASDFDSLKADLITLFHEMQAVCDQAAAFEEMATPAENEE